MRRRPVICGGLVSGLALALAPSAAQAHLLNTGLGPVYDGVCHFALSPEDLLPVAALALFAGRRGPRPARLLLAVLPLAWFAGGALALMLPAAPSVALNAATAVLFLAIGGLLATDIDIRPGLCALVAVALGLVRGAADLAGADAEFSTVLTLAGMAGSVFVLFALAASITLPLRRFWMIVAARVSGSWLAAVGLLLAGWILRYGARVQ